MNNCKIITHKCYFQYSDLQYIPEGLAISTASPTIFFSVIYLQYLKNTKIFSMLIKHLSDAFNTIKTQLC